MAQISGFPLRKGVACQLKWTWNTLRLAESTSACCHRVEPVVLTKENFLEIHNHPVWVEHRRMMLNGEFPSQGCQYCKNIEEQGGFSDRMLHLEKEGLYPPELDKDPECVTVTPRIIEIFIDNSCNLACIYCDESNSSRIGKENQKFGYRVQGVESNDPRYQHGIIPIQPRAKNRSDLVDDFFAFLDKKYLDLRMLNVLGGETFYQKDFPRLLDFIESHNNPELTLTVVTNLMVDPDVLEIFIQRMEKILVSRRLKALHLTASIDCAMPEQEYVRYGFKESQWQRNFESVLTHKWIYVTVNTVIASLTIKAIPGLIEFINRKRKTRKIHHSFGIVDGRPHLHPKIFGPGFFDADFKKIINLMPNHTNSEIANRKYMAGIAKSMHSAKEDKELQRHLVAYLDEIDHRRGLDWSKTFPWLSEHIRTNNVV